MKMILLTLGGDSWLLLLVTVNSAVENILSDGAPVANKIALANTDSRGYTLSIPCIIRWDIQTSVLLDFHIKSRSWYNMLGQQITLALFQRTLSAADKSPSWAHDSSPAGVACDCVTATWTLRTALDSTAQLNSRKSCTEPTLRSERSSIVAIPSVWLIFWPTIWAAGNMWQIFFGGVGLAMVHVSQCTKYEVSRFTHYEAVQNAENGVVWGG